MQGDRIVGKETIPILIGEKKSIRILKTVLGIWTKIRDSLFFPGTAGLIGVIIANIKIVVLW